MAKNFRVLCDDEVIGTSTLEERDAGMGTASGEFEPTPAYRKVRAVFRLFSAAQSETGPVDESLLARYYRERDKLRLSVTTEEGVLVATNVVHISDFAEGPEDRSYEVEVHLCDSSFFS